MAYLLRRLPLSRLLLLGGLVVAIGISLTALAFALGTGPTPPPKPLAEAVHDALTAPAVEGVSANVQLTDHLLEGANLASGSNGTAGQLSSSPLLTGASGRLWISKEGHLRLELQSDKGATEIYYDGHTLSMYDAASNTLYRYTPTQRWAAGDGSAGAGSSGVGAGGARSSTGAGAQISGGFTITPSETDAEQGKIPTVAEIEERIVRASKHADISGATPTDISGRAAYTVRVSPKETGSLIGAAELSWDAGNGVPLRAAILSSTSSSPALELAATSISYGPVEASVFEFTPPANAKVEEVTLPHGDASKSSQADQDGEHPHVRTVGKGITSVAVLESKAKTGARQATEAAALPEGLQKVKLDGVEAAELPTELGTLLSFERSGVRYLLAGAVGPAAVEAVAKGL